MAPIVNTLCIPSYKITALEILEITAADFMQNQPICEAAVKQRNLKKGKKGIGSTGVM